MDQSDLKWTLYQKYLFPLFIVFKFYITNRQYGAQFLKLTVSGFKGRYNDAKRLIEKN